MKRKELGLAQAKLGRNIMPLLKPWLLPIIERLNTFCIWLGL